MTDKLDPVLSEQMSHRGESTDAGPTERITVMIGLCRPADDGILAELAQRGLQVRSVLGDILTGAVDLDHVEAVAACDDVMTVESGGRMAPEVEMGVSGGGDGAPEHTE